MCTTLLLVNQITLSPSVWPRPGWMARISSPFHHRDSPCSKVTMGSAAAAAGGTSRPMILPPAASRLRTLACAKMAAVSAKLGFPPGWSPCRCVLIRNFTGLGESCWSAAWIFGASGAYWSSTMATPSSPTVTPMFPPAPVSNPDVAGHLGGLHLDLGEILLLGDGGRGREHRENENAHPGTIANARPVVRSAALATQPVART